MKSPLWLFLPIVAVLGWCGGRADGIASRDDAVLEAQYAAALQLNAKTRHQVRLLRDDSAAQETENQRLRNRLRSEVREADSVAVLVASARAALDSATTAADSLPHAIRWAMQAEIRADRLERALAIARAGWEKADYEKAKWQHVAGALLVANDSLGNILNAYRSARQCRVLFLPCPSRTTAFMIGGFVGFVGAGLVVW